MTSGVGGDDATASYGFRLDTIDALAISSDGIITTAAKGPITNLNTDTYTSGALVAPTPNFLANIGSNIDVHPLFSNEPKGMYNNRDVGTNEGE